MLLWSRAVYVGDGALWRMTLPCSAVLRAETDASLDARKYTHEMHYYKNRQKEKSNYTAVLCRMPTIQYSARSARLSVHNLFSSCIRRCLVSRACNWVMSALSAVLLIYSFQFRPAFLPRRSVRRHSGILEHSASEVTTIWRYTNVYIIIIIMIYPISDIRRRRKFGEVSYTELTFQRNDFDLISTVKMETKHPVLESFW